MKRLHLFREHPHRINEQEKEQEPTQEQKPELTSHRQQSGDVTEYSVSLDDDNPIWILKLNNKTDSVHAYMSERSIDFDRLDQLYREWPELPMYVDGNVNSGLRAMLMDDGHDDLPPTPNHSSEKALSEDEETSYNQVPNKGILDREIDVCTPDCAEYLVKVKGGSTFMLRVNTETNWCRLVVRLTGREFQLEDIYSVIEELPLMFGGEVNNELRDRLQADGFVIPETPYELSYKVSDKD